MKDVPRSGYLWGKDDGETGKTQRSLSEKAFSQRIDFSDLTSTLSRPGRSLGSQRLHDIYT
jgi:hypothetical protein